MRSLARAMTHPHREMQVEINYPVLMSPVLMVPRALPLAKIQEIYYAEVPLPYRKHAPWPQYRRHAPCPSPALYQINTLPESRSMQNTYPALVPLYVRYTPCPLTLNNTNPAHPIQTLALFSPILAPSSLLPPPSSLLVSCFCCGVQSLSLLSMLRSGDVRPTRAVYL
eukprot:1401072-Rhodomonas_salina.2